MTDERTGPILLGNGVFNVRDVRDLLWRAREVCQIGRSALLCPPMGDSNPKNKQKQQAQHSAKKASNQKKPAVSAVPASGKKK